MKRIILFSTFMLAAGFTVLGQAKPYNVVFDLTSADTTDHQTVIRWMTDIIKGYPDAKLEVVLYGNALPMVTKGKSVVAEYVKKLALNKNISFTVCEIAMNRHHIDKSQLLPGVVMVPDGIYEMITKQAEGFGYIKVAH
jgi:uncharacterized protein